MNTKEDTKTWIDREFAPFDIQQKRIELNTSQLPARDPHDVRYDHRIAVMGYVDNSLIHEVERLRENGWKVSIE